MNSVNFKSLSHVQPGNASKQPNKIPFKALEISGSSEDILPLLGQFPTNPPIDKYIKNETNFINGKENDTIYFDRMHPVVEDLLLDFIKTNTKLQGKNMKAQKLTKGHL